MYCYSIIATVGQSVISNADKPIREGVAAFTRQPSPNLAADLKQIKNGVHDFPGKQWHEMILAGLHDKAKNPELLRRASAELNHLVPTLAGTNPNSNDVIHFIASETIEGVLSARILADFCRDYFGRAAEVHVVEGLQVQDGQRFRRLGLSSLIELVFRLLRQADPSVYKRILNPTGGFKGVVPYLTLIGMLHQDVEIAYIYEFSDELITLAGLPFTLDFGKMESAYDALLRAKRDPLSEQDLREALHTGTQPVSEHPLWSLFDFIEDGDERLYEPSGLGRIVLENFKDKLKTPVWLSEQAATYYDESGSNWQAKYGALLDRLGDADWRTHHQHGVLNQATIIKPGNVDERLYFYEMPDGGLLVPELARHLTNDDYDRKPTRKSDYHPFRRWDS